MLTRSAWVRGLWPTPRAQAKDSTAFDWPGTSQALWVWNPLKSLRKNARNDKNKVAHGSHYAWKWCEYVWFIWCTTLTWDWHITFLLSTDDPLSSKTWRKAVHSFKSDTQILWRMDLCAIKIKGIGNQSFVDILVQIVSRQAADGFPPSFGFSGNWPDQERPFWFGTNMFVWCLIMYQEMQYLDKATVTSDDVTPKRSWII